MPTLRWPVDVGDLLGGITDDLFPIYVLRAGRAGGQFIKGGINAADNLDLYPSAHGAPTGSIRAFGPFQLQPDSASHTGSGNFWRNTANLIKFYSGAEYTMLAALTSSLAQGAIFYWNGTSLVALAPSTSGLPLKTLGAGADPAWGTLDHNAVLTNLASGDVHTQYAILAGRASGQVLKGGTGASETLDLYATANVSPTTSALIRIFSALQLGSQVTHTAAGAFWSTGSVLKYVQTGPTERTLLAPPSSGLAQGDVPYWTGSNTAMLAPGTAGLPLLTGGAGANPSYATLAPAAITNGTIGTVLQSGDTTPEFGPHTIRHRRTMGFYSVPGATNTWTTWGHATTPTVSGAGTPLNTDSNTRPSETQVTGTSNGDAAGVISGFDVCRIGWLPDWTWVVTAGNNVSSYRHWIGFSSADLAAVGTPTTQSVAAFVYDTGVDGTAFWRTLTCDGASNVTRTATSVAVSAGTTYSFRIHATSGTNIKFYIDDVLVRTETGTSPAANVLLGWLTKVTTLTNAARRQGLSRAGGMII